MNKLNNDYGLDLGAVSLAVLKTAEEGDEILFADHDGGLALFHVEAREARRGRHGGTTLQLRDLKTDMVLRLTTTNALPDGVLRVWKCLAGVNARTLRKVVPGAPVTVPAAPAAEPEPELITAAQNVQSTDALEPEVSVTLDEGSSETAAAIAALVSD